jgi:dienelactone hydrolase
VVIIAVMLERFSRLPSALHAAARWRRLGMSEIPAMIVHPDWAGAEAAANPAGGASDGSSAASSGGPSGGVPVVIWMHGRTARKEIDPGRPLRLLRAGIGFCAVDLPGHGERYDAALQHPAHSLDLILQMIDETDEIIDALRKMDIFDPHRMGIGGMSAGGMAALARLCHEHPFRCASVEAATGSWNHQRHREMFRDRSGESLASENPLANLHRWREIPLQAIHARGDEWVAFEGQRVFLDALRARYRDPGLIEFIIYEHTGAPYEHAGFGKHAADAKQRQRDFFVWHLAGASV